LREGTQFPFKPLQTLFVYKLIPNAAKQIPSQNLYMNYPLFLLEIPQQQFTVKYRFKAIVSYIIYEQIILVLLY